MLINAKSKIMKNLLFSTFIVASLLVGTTTISAQTKSKSDATVINNDVKVKPVTKVVTPKVTDQKVNSTITVTKENSTQNNAETSPVTSSKAIPAKKVLKKVDKESLSATPIKKEGDSDKK